MTGSDVASPVREAALHAGRLLAAGLSQIRLERRWSGAMPSTVKRAAVAGLLIGAAGLLAPEILGVGHDSVRGRGKSRGPGSDPSGPAAP